MRSLLLILFIGTAIRFLFVGNTGFVADVSFWKSWSLAAIDHGIVWTSQNTNINYPPGFIYILWFMGKIYSIFGNPHDFNVFWRENNFAFLFVSKSLAIASDIAIACLLYWFVSKIQNSKFKVQNDEETLKKFPKKTISEIDRPAASSDSPRIGYLAKKIGSLFSVGKSEKFVSKGHVSKLTIYNLQLTTNLPLLLTAVFFLNPVVILDSAIWGQVESFGLLFTLVAILLLFKRHPLLASIIFTIGTQMKLQNIIFIPLFYLFILRTYDVKTLVRALSAAATMFFVMTLPFIVANKMYQVLYLLTVNNDYFPYLSLHAHNIWWIVAKAQGMEIIDKITVMGILNAKTVGLLLFSLWYFLCCLLLFLKPTRRNAFLALCLSVFAFFLFTTQSHERYSYPVLVFLLFLYPFLEVKKRWQRVYFWLTYCLLTVTIFLNLNEALYVNYPKNAFGFLYFTTTPVFTITNSVLLIFLFFMLVWYVFSQVSFLVPIFSVVGFIVLVILLHIPYLSSDKLSLTAFKPIVAQQDFGKVQMDKSVNSIEGWKKWNRLSNNYFFYRKGFGVHANSRLVFDINRKFTSFSTDMGVDTEANTRASIVFEIYGDDKLLFQSEKMGRFDFPGFTKVDVTGVKHLALVANDAGDGNTDDHADWLNPILYK